MLPAPLRSWGAVGICNDQKLRDHGPLFRLIGDVNPDPIDLKLEGAAIEGGILIDEGNAEAHLILRQLREIFPIPGIGLEGKESGFSIHARII